MNNKCNKITDMKPDGKQISNIYGEYNSITQYWKNT